MVEKIEDSHGFYDLVAEYMEQPCHGRCIADCFGDYNDPVARYVEKLCSVNGWLWLCSRDQVPYHNLFPFGPSMLFLIKHEEKIIYGVIFLIGFTGSQKLLDWELMLSK